MYILNLAIADECFLIGIPFLLTTMHMENWIFGHAICKAFMVSTSITQFTSSIFLFIMSADRYVAICHHISSPKYRTPMVSRIVSLVAWATSAVIMIPIFLYANVINKGNGHYSCAILWPESASHIPGLFSFTIYSFLLGFAIPLCFIMTFYCLVIRKLRSVAKKTNRPKGKRRSHRKVTKLVLTVITVYILCWLPYWLGNVWLITSSGGGGCGPSSVSVNIFLIVGCLGYFNSAINPILYAYLSDNFKKSFLKACTCAAAKDVNAQLKLDNSGVATRNVRGDHRNSETAQTFTSRTGTVKGFGDAVTTTTAMSNVSSRNPSPPNNNYRNGVAEVDSPMIPMPTDLEKCGNGNATELVQFNATLGYNADNNNGLHTKNK